MFESIKNRVKFVDYSKVADMYEGLLKANNSKW